MVFIAMQIAFIKRLLLLNRVKNVQECDASKASYYVLSLVNN